MKELKLQLSYQTERGNTHSQSIYDSRSNTALRSINDATQIMGGEIIRHIPEGGQISDSRSGFTSYTMRAQLNYDKVFANNHQLTVLGGAERRSVATASTVTHRFGYNEKNLQFIPINAKELASIKGTESIEGDFTYNEASSNYFTDAEDRYISFYGNAGYTYLEKYSATFSARIDDSNLFGSDPKYRYLPMWSAGLSWHLGKEEFLSEIEWINGLTVRATYGINGNVVRKVGPFLQARSLFNPEGETTGTRIVSPPNRSLRWEKTEVTNFGVDFALLSNRLSGSIDYYHKYTSHLLGSKELDPTNAFLSALINYGSMRNRGFEFSLSSINIRTKQFRWNSLLNFSYNKNKLTEISAGAESLYNYTSGYGCDRAGYPMGSLFNYRWAGLHPENGTPMVYSADGEIITNHDALGRAQYNVTDKEDVFYSGSIHPVYTVGFSNTIVWRNFTATCLIVANGGNYLRDAVPQILTNANFSGNLPKAAANFWRAPGDEEIPGIMPAPDVTSIGSSDYGTLWTAADINTIKADYLKVRSITLAYNIPPNIFGRKTFADAKLSLQINNPYKWVANDRGLDPEAYSAYSIYAQRTLPAAPSFILGLNITF